MEKSIDYIVYIGVRVLCYWEKWVSRVKVKFDLGQREGQGFVWIVRL